MQNVACNFFRPHLVTMRSKYLIPTILLLFFSQKVLADSPPCWCKFDVKSKNSKFIATVDRVKEDSLKEPWNARWILTITRDSAGKGIIWTTLYKYSGYPDGQLSDDGIYFVYVEGWFYKDVPLIKIYKKGAQIDTKTLTGDSFKIPKSKLRKSVSHELWISDKGVWGFQSLNGQSVFAITTVDNKRHFINLDKGNFFRTG